MTIERTFKNLILLDFSIIILYAISVFFEPEEITNIHDNLVAGFFENETASIIFYVLVGIWFLIYLISLVLLYRFVRFGKPLFVIVITIGLVMMLISPPFVSTPVQATLDWVDGAAIGAILVFLYFTPIKDKFSRQN